MYSPSISYIAAEIVSVSNHINIGGDEFYSATKLSLSTPANQFAISNSGTTDVTVYIKYYTIS